MKLHFKLTNYIKEIPIKFLFPSVVILLLGFVVRLIYISDAGYFFDTITTQYAWAKVAWEMGVPSFWKNYIGLMDYLPGWIYLISIYYGVASFLVNTFQLPYATTTVFVVLLKLTGAMADAGLAILFYKFYTSKGVEKSKKAFGLVLSCIIFSLPQIWFISGIWGQFDSLVIFFSFLSIYLIFSENSGMRYRFVIAGIIFGLAVMLKIQALIVAPIILIKLFSFIDSKEIFKFVTGSLIWVILQTLVFQLYVRAENTFAFLVVSQLILFILPVYYFYKKRTHEKNNSFNNFFLSFFSVNLSIALIPIIFGPARFLINLAGPIIKDDQISNSASTFWPMLTNNIYGHMTLFSIGNFNMTTSLAGSLVFITISISALAFLYKSEITSFIQQKNYNIYSFTENLFKSTPQLVSLFALFTIYASAYFLFMIKMHSRYFFWGIIGGIFTVSILARLKNLSKKILYIWIAGTIISGIGFFMNNAFTLAKWNKAPDWVEWLAVGIPGSSITLYSVVNLIGFMLCFIGFILLLKERRKNHENN